MSIFSATVMLLFIMDPLGNIPVFLSALKDVPKERVQKVILRELLVALFILLVFLFSGEHLLSFLHLRQESISIAGGIVLFLIALKMVFPSDGLVGEALDGEPFIVPLAIPLVAGPSTLATLLLLTQNNPEKFNDWLIAILIAWAITATILYFSTHLYKILRKRGLIAMERLMGMLLVMISVQMLLDGLEKYLK